MALSLQLRKPNPEPTPPKPTFHQPLESEGAKAEHGNKKSDFSSQSKKQKPTDNNSVLKKAIISKPTKNQKTQRMKKTLLAAIAIAGIAVTTGAQAQSNIGSGSALLYFNKIADRPDSGTVPLADTLVVNLGDLSSTTFTSFNLSLNTALVAAYGANWSTDDTIKWAVIGGFDGETPAPKTYGKVFSRTAPSVLDLQTVYNLSPKTDALVAEANAVIWTTGSIISTIGATHKTVRVENGTLNADNVVSNGTGFYAQDLTGFEVWNGTLATYQYQANSQNIYFSTLMDAQGEFGDQPTINTGTISLASNGTLSVNSVPEPSTYALFGFAALILIVAYRRANA